MNATMMRTPVLITIASLLAACQGSQSTPALPQAVPAAKDFSGLDARTAHLTIVVHVPSQERARGLVFEARGASDIRAAFAIDRGRCCTLRFDVKPGRYIAKIATYDRVPVNGTIPAGARELANVRGVRITVAPQGETVVPFTTSGVIATLQIPDFPDAVAGQAFPGLKTFPVQARNAAGAYIVGTYKTPISITDPDKTGATSLTTGGVDAPPAGKLVSSSDEVLFSYNGLAIDPVAISATASGAKGATISFTPQLAPIVVTPESVNLNGIAGAQASAALTASEVGWTNAPYNKKLNASAASGGCATVATVTPASGTAFTVKASTSSPSTGSCALTISDGIGQEQTIPVALAAGTLYVANSTAGKVQAIAPSGSVTTVLTGQGTASGVAADANGNVYATSVTTNGVIQIGAYGGYQTVPSFTCTNSYSVAVDPVGDIFCGTNDGSIDELSSTGVTSTVATGLGIVESMTTDGAGNLYVTNTTQLLEYSANKGTYQLSIANANGVALDGTGDIFLSEGGAGVVEYVFGGDGATVNLGTGWASNAALGITVDSAGNVYAGRADGSVVQIAPPFTNGGTMTTLVPAGTFSVPAALALSYSVQPFVRGRPQKAVSTLLTRAPTRI
ncbi:MAG: hypothetical protein JO199_01150 [Candidatus Eremiobacteraeota bacterium]|nr:hypothetical protein [Candidatus Eremiobacteraeota bacterium]